MPIPGCRRDASRQSVAWQATDCHRSVAAVFRESSDMRSRLSERHAGNWLTPRSPSKPRFAGFGPRSPLGGTWVEVETSWARSWLSPCNRTAGITTPRRAMATRTLTRRYSSRCRRRRRRPPASRLLCTRDRQRHRRRSGPGAAPLPRFLRSSRRPARAKRREQRWGVLPARRRETDHAKTTTKRHLVTRSPCPVTETRMTSWTVTSQMGLVPAPAARGRSACLSVAVNVAGGGSNATGTRPQPLRVSVPAGLCTKPSREHSQMPCSACVRRRRSQFCSFDDEDPTYVPSLPSCRAC